jgi:DNA-binding MarR family transcriptional regulator
MTVTAPPRSDARAAADEFAQLFPALYLRLHARRDKDGHRPPAQAMAVLQHLALSGPLTVGEAARHFGRAQSAVSELVERLAERGLVARLRDERDRRRVLVWLTPAGLELLERDRQVLSPERTQAALARMTPAARRGLLAGMKALVAAADEAARAAATGGARADDETTRSTRRRRR